MVNSHHNFVLIKLPETVKYLYIRMEGMIIQQNDYQQFVFIFPPPTIF